MCQQIYHEPTNSWDLLDIAISANLRSPPSSLSAHHELVSDHLPVTFTISFKHFQNNCQGIKCRQCYKPHHTLLHLEKEHPPKETGVNPDATSIANCATKLSFFTQTLLPTAQVICHDSRGAPHILRALLDSGSQSHFISEEIVK